jgi:hypothetical protein
MLSAACGGRSEIPGGELTVAGANAAASSGAGGRANQLPITQGGAARALPPSDRAGATSLGGAGANGGSDGAVPISTEPQAFTPPAPGTLDALRALRVDTGAAIWGPIVLKGGSRGFSYDQERCGDYLRENFRSQSLNIEFCVQRASRRAGRCRKFCREFVASFAASGDALGVGAPTGVRG